MLRITAGKFKGKVLNLPPSTLTRPSTDRLRQAVFNILSNYIDFNGIKVLDAFAGSGALGLEALSRGASMALFCENSQHVSKILQKNIFETLKMPLENIANIAELHNDLFTLKSNHQFDLVFVDPPYDLSLEIKTIDHLYNQRALAKNAVMVIEQRKNSPLITHEKFTALPPRIYGNCQITFLFLN